MRARIVVAVLTGLMVLAVLRPAHAGPPLICHPFQTGGAPSLPWGSGPGWNTPDPSYDIARVPADTMRLLAAEKQIVPRMETLRRATIYASRDPRVAYELLAGVFARALRAAAVGSPDDLAWFDAGYLVESVKQSAGINERAGTTRPDDSRLRQQVAGLDGYAWTRRAIELSGGNADMEFAASLMKGGTVAEQHRRRAQAAARPGSLLANALAATDPGPSRSR